MQLRNDRSALCKHLILLVPAHGLEPRFTPSKGAVLRFERSGNWWSARVARPVLRLKRPLHHFNAFSPSGNGTRGEIRTHTGGALDAVPLLLGYAGIRKENGLRLHPYGYPSGAITRRFATGGSARVHLTE